MWLCIRYIYIFSGAYEGGAAPPSTHAPPERLMGGIHGEGSSNITSACISLPQVRHSGLPRGDSSHLAPWEFQKYKIKRKHRLKSNTWQWQRLRICLNSLLIQGEKSFSLIKRILHYTRCTMTESRLNDLALIYSFTPCLSSLLKKIIEMFVQANPRKF